MIGINQLLRRQRTPASLNLIVSYHLCVLPGFSVSSSSLVPRS